MASDQGRREGEPRSEGERRQQGGEQKRRASSSASSQARRSGEQSSQRRRTGDTRKPAAQRSAASSARGSANSSSGKQRRSAQQARTQAGGTQQAKKRAGSTQRRPAETRRTSPSTKRSADTSKRSSATRKEGFTPSQILGPMRDKLQHAFAGVSAGSLQNVSKPIIAAACVAVLALVLLVHHSLRLRIQLNGEKTTIWQGTSVERLLEKKLVDPAPGNLVAVDGSVLAEGEGERCTATIDGTVVNDLKTKIHRGADLEITDGGDITEDFTTSEETIPHDTVDGSREFESYWYTSLHLLSDGEDGILVSRTGKQSGITVSEVEKPAVDAGYITYTAQPDEKAIALTFDDGPWPETTDQILDILEENGAKATFFTIGNQIASYSDEVRRAHQMGCQVCTHSWDHAAGAGQGTNLTLMSSQEQIDEVLKGYQAIADALGTEPTHVIRAPGGNFYGSIIDTLWPYVDVEVGWDVDTEDWRLPGSDVIAERILGVQSGQVVLMHDGGGDRTQTVEALRTALPQLKNQGYKFVTIDEMLAYGRPNADTSGATTESGLISIG